MALKAGTLSLIDHFALKNSINQRMDVDENTFYLNIIFTQGLQGDEMKTFLLSVERKG